MRALTTRAQLGRQLKSLLSSARRGDVACLARLLSLVEGQLFEVLPFLEKLSQIENKMALRLGITGPPGAGKSSLINLLAKSFRAKKLKVAILAVDPSSPFSGGALLGDRIRMHSHSLDKNVFIRSIGSRGGSGGLSASTGAMALILEATGFDIVIIETVGVGQTELDVMNLADATAVVLVPESGDVIQTLKAGILEIADLFVVNKSDRDGAQLIARELNTLVEQEGAQKREVLLTSTTKNEGVDEFAKALIQSAQKNREIRRNAPDRLRRELVALVLWGVQLKVEAKAQKLKIKNVYRSFRKF